MTGTELLEAAGREAEALRHSWIGVEHLLLALGAGDGAAAEALGELDLELAPPGGEWEGALATPALQETLAFVEGFAAGRAPTPEDALIAALWLHPEHFARSRDRVAARLRAAGVAVPELPAPPRPVEWGEAVHFPPGALAEVLHALHRLHPHVKVAFDRDGEQAWLRAERGVDVAALV